MTYIIAEIGINHNGDVDLAKHLIDMASVAGCDAVKFQKRDVETVYTKAELDAPRESPWGTTNREQKLGLEFSIDEYDELFHFARERHLAFGVSCWDLKSVELIERNIPVDFHKVASALITHKEFLRTLKKTGKPVYLSTGMSTPEEVSNAVWTLEDSVKCIMACTSTYPTKAEEVNLNYIRTLAAEFPGLPVGFSNHYNGHDACVAAAALGAEFIEFHITHDRTAYGSDQAASIENPSGLVAAVRAVEKMLGTGVKKVYDSEVPIKKKLRRESL